MNNLVSEEEWQFIFNVLFWQIDRRVHGNLMSPATIKLSSCKVHSFNQIWIFWTDFHKSPVLSNFTDVRPVVVALLYTDEWVHRSDKAIRCTF
jgi:hypothetical protein